MRIFSTKFLFRMVEIGYEIGVEVDGVAGAEGGTLPSGYLLSSLRFSCSSLPLFGRIVRKVGE